LKRFGASIDVVAIFKYVAQKLKIYTVRKLKRMKATKNTYPISTRLALDALWVKDVEWDEE